MTQKMVRDLAIEIAEIQEKAAGHPVAEDLVALRRRVQEMDAPKDDHAADIVTAYRRRAKQQWIALNRRGASYFWDEDGLLESGDLRALMLAAEDFVGAAQRALRAEEDREAVQ
jgi:hypothetical protein